MRFQSLKVLGLGSSLLISGKCFADAQISSPLPGATVAVDFDATGSWDCPDVNNVPQSGYATLETSNPTWYCDMNVEPAVSGATFTGPCHCSPGTTSTIHVGFYCGALNADPSTFTYGGGETNENITCAGS